MALYERIQETAFFIKERTGCHPAVGIIAGSGLGMLANGINITTELPYANIPGFKETTVSGHSGKLVFGTIGSKEVVLMTGRFHYYEGYSMQEVTFPVRVMRALGADALIVSNAAGGMNPAFKVGDIMLIRDHINYFPEHPLRGANDPRLGTRFPDMSEVYDKKLLSIAEQIAAEQGVTLQKGVYIGVQGPTYETPAEYAGYHNMGADAVGMSTVPEVIAARHGGMRVFAASIITDLGVAGTVAPISHEEVLAAAAKATPKLAALVKELVMRM